MTICQNIPGPCRNTPTLLPGWSAQFTGISTTRYPAACAARSSSTSKPKPRVRSPTKRRSAAAALKTLNPHCESATDRRPSRATSQLKTRPAATRCGSAATDTRSEEHMSELQSRSDLVCRLLLEKKKIKQQRTASPRESQPAQHAD